MSRVPVCGVWEGTTRCAEGSPCASRRASGPINAGKLDEQRTSRNTFVGPGSSSALNHSEHPFIFHLDSSGGHGSLRPDFFQTNAPWASNPTKSLNAVAATPTSNGGRPASRLASFSANPGRARPRLKPSLPRRNPLRKKPPNPSRKRLPQRPPQLQHKGHLGNGTGRGAGFNGIRKGGGHEEPLGHDSAV